MKNLIETNAAQLRELHAEIKATFTHRQQNDLQKNAWQEACRRFHQSYDALAFPGGLGNGLLLLEKHDVSAIETAIRFLESDPWFCRSGYIKAELMKRLRQAPLREDQRKRLQEVILTRIQDKNTPREFRWYARLARVVSDPDFGKAVSALAVSTAPAITMHAQWVLAQLPLRRHQRT